MKLQKFDVNWRKAAAAVYLWICLFDFFAVPLLLAYFEKKTPEDIAVMIESVKDLDVDENKVMEFVSKNYRSVTPNWTPFTLRGGGLFHLSFGALLTGAAIRKKE